MHDTEHPQALPETAAEPSAAGGDGAPTAVKAISRPAARKRRRHKRGRAIEVALLAVSLALLLMLGLVLGSLVGLGGGLQSLFKTSGTRQNPPAGSYSIINIEGAIQSGGSTYQHTATVDYIKKMTEDEGNLGLLLYLNSSGGGVYESDEVYRALQRYKEETGRPVWAYMGKTCASGGYYIAAAADEIYASPGCTTGSIGVYYQLTDASGLYGMLGIKTVLVRSGPNKGIGADGVEITEENRAVYQSMVDESYGIFVDIVAESRGISKASLATIADGRPYTALQALDSGLVDEIAEYDDVKKAFEALCGGEGYQTSFAGTNALRQLINSVTGQDDAGETEALLALAEAQQSGLMAEAGGLA